MDTIELLTVPEQTLRLRWPPAVRDPAIFRDLCRANPDYRIELTPAGEIEIMPPTGIRTGRRNAALVARLLIWAEADGTGEAFDSSTGFRFPDGAIRSPDAAWVRRDRLQSLAAEDKDGFAPLVPDFVAELRSASDSSGMLQAKMEEYRKNGVGLGWLLEPQERRVLIYRPGQPVEILTDAESVSGEPELPGFVLDLRRIWAPGF
ncbi:MAG: Uma2 family endonuclease [Candidatus Competibacteraceae bacterium]|nr:Uma2 family endonuclease [Candidatus Competibacteraceae bacterium]